MMIYYVSCLPETLALYAANDAHHGVAAAAHAR